MFRVMFFAIVALAGFTPLQHVTAQQSNKATTQPVSTTTLSEDQKIDMLLNYIRGLKGATCIRNGSQHDPAEAADHLQVKREKHASEVKTAEEFIQHLATKSSMSGEYYTVKMPDGQVVRLGDLLKRELKRIEGK
ncbi:DUF5329 family protein [Pontibacter ruber]|uniref:DUF5329 family protein n=1 Tax=Pontibacter ruber TaxID=1343895 RepID=A0ABW5CYF0_9BACT|nr:DUF5329 family protein [Pontibacter ruber]